MSRSSPIIKSHAISKRGDEDDEHIEIKKSSSVKNSRKVAAADDSGEDSGELSTPNLVITQSPSNGDKQRSSGSKSKTKSSRKTSTATTLAENSTNPLNSSTDTVDSDGLDGDSRKSKKKNRDVSLFLPSFPDEVLVIW